ncbi:YugN family protein [Evansella sp. AB-P1]|uniref:YugN family protein n=1 Tax=Evansella sp. AB-P1 TaxID=3037653 RepID=UPI00241CDA26|nr:YugN family protein [Evansella sp. AB-P1]MDG5788322.1 YugN family protein [Evansella sp. AB-P1]
MKFEETELEGLSIEFHALEEIMENAGFHSVYDYERVTFDYKIVDNVRDHVYYFRVQAFAVEGEVPNPHSIVKVFKLILGKHYYPHGVEYDEDFPKTIVDKCKKKIELIKEQIKSEAI